MPTANIASEAFPPNHDHAAAFISVIVPVLNEEAVLSEMVTRVREVLFGTQMEYEIILVNDGSTDATGALLSAASCQDDRLKVITFSRNFGHQAAVTAGLDFCNGEIVIVIDADLQDPPELIPRLIQAYSEGFDVVSPERMSRKGEALWRRAFTTAFYALMERFSSGYCVPQVGDFRLFSSRVVISVRKMREQQRFIRGMVKWLGFPEKRILFDRAARVAGNSKYGFFKLCSLAIAGIASFSTLPALLLSGIAGGLSLSGIFCISSDILEDVAVKPAASLKLQIGLLLFCTSLLIASSAIICTYCIWIHMSGKQRPLYVVTDLLNIDPPDPTPRDAIILVPGTRMFKPNGIQRSHRHSPSFDLN